MIPAEAVADAADAADAAEGEVVVGVAEEVVVGERAWLSSAARCHWRCRRGRRSVAAGWACRAE